jgi:hypothetical protein
VTHWEIAGVIVGVLVIATIILSVLRPASRISFGVFFERQINGATKSRDEHVDRPSGDDQNGPQNYTE